MTSPGRFCLPAQRRHRDDSRCLTPPSTVSTRLPLGLPPGVWWPARGRTRCRHPGRSSVITMREVAAAALDLRLSLPTRNHRPHGYRVPGGESKSFSEQTPNGTAQASSPLDGAARSAIPLWASRRPPRLADAHTGRPWSVRSSGQAGSARTQAETPGRPPGCAFRFRQTRRPPERSAAAIHIDPSQVAGYSDMTPMSSRHIARRPL